MLAKFAPKGLPGLIVLSFTVGCGMELFMAKVQINHVSFYQVVKRKKAERIVDAEEAAAVAALSSNGAKPADNQRL
jgi:hypothetical protein